MYLSLFLILFFKLCFENFIYEYYIYIFMPQFLLCSPTPSQIHDLFFNYTVYVYNVYNNT